MSLYTFTTCFSAAQDQNLAPHQARKNDTVAVVVHLLHRQDQEAAHHSLVVVQGLVQRVPVQDRGLNHVPAQDLPKDQVQGRRGLVFML